MRPNYEIEKKFLIHKLPSNLAQYTNLVIEQGYLCTAPVIRVRKKNEDYIFTYKSAGMMMREEYEHPLTKESYEHLIKKADGNVITKTRYLIPYNELTIELDVFSGIFAGLVIAEVEFSSLDEAKKFTPPEWFSDEVTDSSLFHNSVMSEMDKTSIESLIKKYGVA